MSRMARATRGLATKSTNDVVILSAVRSPITRSFKDGFKDAWPEDILGPVMAEAPRRANIEPKDVQDVLIGNVLAELGFAKTGRMTLLNAGFPAATPLAHSIWAGQTDVAMAGGVESMSKNYQTRGVPIDVGPSLRSTMVKSAADCLMSMGNTSENVAKLNPVFAENGGSTAGNSSQISDGASATILARRSWAESRGLKPLGRFLATQVAGCEPDEMGMGLAYAISKLYKYIGIEQKDVDIFELNEAFASQTLACILGLGLDVEKVNPNGGSIALGHPTGATGTRQLATMFAEMARQNSEIGIVSMCASTGLGVASAFIRE